MRCISVLSLALALLAGVPRLSAEGPDDQFIRIYNLIQQGDALRASGQTSEARDKYVEARSALLQLQANNPNWNPKIVSYRMDYLAERIGPEGKAPPVVPAEQTAKPGTATPPPVAGQGANQRTTELDQEIKGLKAERDLLQAKLREALAVQPAAVDPRELAQAEKRLKELLAENDRLRQEAARQQEKLAKAVDPARYAEAQKAAKDAQQAFQRQTGTVTALTKERDALQQQLRKATGRAQPKPARARPEVPKGTQAPSGSAAATNARIAELTDKLNEANKNLAAEKSHYGELLAEKLALEKRVADLSARHDRVATPSGTATPKPKPAEAKATKAAEKAQIKLLERERDELRKRVAGLTRQLEDRKLRKTDAAQSQLVEELSILRARVQVYEARQVPLTPEEMTLFKQTASNAKLSETGTSPKSTRQIPAAAASLVAEAQRAVQNHRLEEAERKFKQALTFDEKNLVLLSNLGATYLDQNRLDDAEAVLKRALAQDPNDPQCLSLQGLLRFRQGKYDEALDTLSRAAQLDPDNPMVQNYLGVTLSQKGQHQPAETALRRAIQLDAGYAEAHYNLAVVYATEKPPSIELTRWHYQKALAAGQPKNADIEKLLQATPTASTNK